MAAQAERDEALDALAALRLGVDADEETQVPKSHTRQKLIAVAAFNRG